MAQAFQEKPFVLAPETYDVICYPCEWLTEVGFNNSLMAEHSDVYYHREWGKHTVVCLWTLFFRINFGDWFKDNVAVGYRTMLTNCEPEKMPVIMYNEAFSLLQQHRLKEVSTNVLNYRKLINGYVAVPLMPVALATPVLTKLDLPDVMDAIMVKGLLTDLLSATN